MLRAFSFLLLFSLLGQASGVDFFPAPPCVGLNVLAKSGPYEGQRLATRPPPLPMYHDADWFLMGHGIAGGPVYRVRLKTGESIILKHYNEESSLKNDLNAFAILGAAFRPRSTAPPFGIVGYHPVRDDVLQLTNLRGRTVQNVLLNGGEAASEVNLLFEGSLLHTRELLERWVLDKARSGWVRKYDFTIVNHSLVGHIEFNDRRGRVTLWLRPDNVLLTEDGRMVIIDPY